MGVAIDQPRRDPGAAQRLDLPRLIAGELGPPPDPDDPAVLDADRAILDRAERRGDGRVHGGDVAVDEQPVPHGSPSTASACIGQSMSWKSIADLLTDDADAPVALLGAPMEAGSVTPGRCDLAPETVRRALRRFSTFDLETGEDIDFDVQDLGDVPVRGLSPADGFRPIRDAVLRATATHDLTLLIGGNNAVTRPAAHGLGLPLERVGLITLDAHFDMRETDDGPMNGNPVRCLLEDGLPGRNIVQIGLAPFANTRKMHDDALAAGIGTFRHRRSASRMGIDGRDRRSRWSGSAMSRRSSSISTST